MAGCPPGSWQRASRLQGAVPPAHYEASLVRLVIVRLEAVPVGVVPLSVMVNVEVTRVDASPNDCPLTDPLTLALDFSLDGALSGAKWKMCVCWTRDEHTLQPTTTEGGPGSFLLPFAWSYMPHAVQIWMMRDQVFYLRNRVLTKYPGGPVVYHIHTR